jgi:3-oxoadipate enol-lactonase
MPHADVNGQRLYYEVHGEGEPLLMVMGLGGDLLAWAPQIPAWSEQYRLIALENRDVGRSSYADGPYEIADMTDDTPALADELGLDDFHLLGLSMGGAIVQTIALRAPERVRTLTLAVTWGGSGPYGAARSRVMGEQIKRMSPEEHVDQLMLLTMSEEFYENPESVAWLRRMILRNPHPQTTDGFLRQFDACGRHDVRDRLGELSMPTHVIGAAHDVMVPPWKSTELAELIPGAQLTMLDRAPHMVNIETAERFNAAVLDFLAAQRASASERTTAS